jgi:hypothetical protein
MPANRADHDSRTGLLAHWKPGIVRGRRQNPEASDYPSPMMVRMPTHQIDPRHRTIVEPDVRVLRAALDGARRLQGLAKVGAVVAMACLAAALIVVEFLPWLALALFAAAPLVFVVAGLPFWSMRCPRCHGRFHSTTLNLGADAQVPRCASCGLDLEAHLPRYGRGQDWTRLH